MTTVSFTVPESADLGKILNLLKIFDVKNITTTGSSAHGLTEEDLRNIEISRQQVKRGESIKSEDVHKLMMEKYGN